MPFSSFILSPRHFSYQDLIIFSSLEKYKSIKAKTYWVIISSSLLPHTEKRLCAVPFIPANLAAVSPVQGTITSDRLLQLLSRHSRHACHQSLGSRAESVFLSGALGATRRGGAVFLGDLAAPGGWRGPGAQGSPRMLPLGALGREQNNLTGLKRGPESS